ncbi:kinase-like domain-containing protein, partial [Ganoderma leucocontextum]
MAPSSEAKDATQPHPLSNAVIRCGLFKDEYFWRDHQPWLADSGYMLRPRYRLDWDPSWLKSKKHPLSCEDGQSPLRTTIMDAVRTPDGRIVALKQVPKLRYPDEEELNRFLTMSEPLTSDRRNHSIPVYDILQSLLDEDVLFLVMPYLVRINTLKFATVGEAVECFRQLFEGLQFLHHHHVAHLDIHINNLMMDPTPIFSDTPHPTHSYKSYDFKHSIRTRTRTSNPTRYFYIDFGLSARLPPEDPSPRIGVDIGGDKTVPEYRDPNGLHDPYKIDVYCLGNILREHFMDKSHSLEFLRPVVAEMVQHDPAERPSIDMAFEQFERLRASLSQRTLRSRMVYRDELALGRLYRGCRHVLRTAFWMVAGTPALPTP